MNIAVFENKSCGLAGLQIFLLKFAFRCDDRHRSLFVLLVIDKNVGQFSRDGIDFVRIDDKVEKIV